MHDEEIVYIVSFGVKIILMALNDTFFRSSNQKRGDKSSKIQREMRKTEIYRLQIQGLTDEEILASLNHDQIVLGTRERLEVDALPKELGPLLAKTEFVGIFM